MHAKLRVLLFSCSHLINLGIHNNIVRRNSSIKKNSLMSTFCSAIATTEQISSSTYIDVHAHLIHEKFAGEEDTMAEKCRECLEYVVVNGLEPVSNRAVLELCGRHPNLLPALGIYPLDAACNVITPSTWSHSFDPPTPFDVDAEIDFIDEMASTKKIVALGECGLDR